MEDESGLGSSSDVKLLTFAEYADEMCPIYMSMGVPYHEYWHGDYTQLKHYRKAFELQRERSDYDAWLHGAYIYDALCMVSPVLHAFAKNGATPHPYHKEPFSMKTSAKTTNSASENPTMTKEEIAALNASARFASFATQFNKRFDSKGGGQCGAAN